MLSAYKLERLRGVVNEKLFPITLILIAFVLPFPKLIFFNILMVILGLLWLVKGNLKGRVVGALSNKYVLLFICNYFIFAIWLIFSDDAETGLGLLGKKALLLAFPIILAAENLDKKLVQKVIVSFVLACLTAATLSVLFIIYEHWQSGERLGSLTIESFYRDRLNVFLNFHPTYFSTYITFSAIAIAFFLLDQWDNLSVLKRIGISGIFVYFVIINILLSARMPMIVLLIIVAIIYVRFFSRHRVAATAMLLVTVGIIVLSFQHSYVIRERFEEIRHTELAPPVGVHHNSTNLRVGIWSCSLTLLKDHWLFGVGTGSVQHYLNNCYQSNGYSDVMYKLSYNTHNQYLFNWLNSGIVGMILFILSLFIPLYIGWQKKNYFYMSFLVLIILVCITEAILERQKGIVFYAFFNAILAFHCNGPLQSTSKT
jgi:hypothetical protein